jgi:hypothetical protein
MGELKWASETYSKIVAYYFSYVGGDPDTVRFYNRYIKGLLRWHRGSAVWIKAGTVKREAYLVVKDYLKDAVARVLSDGLSQAGFLSFKVVNPFFMIHQAKKLNLETKGYFRYGDIELGDYDETFCPLENYRQVSIREHCLGTEEGHRVCLHWDRYRCAYPKKTDAKVKTTWCPDKQTQIPSLQCQECKKSDFAKWRACQEFKEEERINIGL